MNLRNIFRRTRPTPAPTRLDPLEMTILRWHNLTPEQWATLDNPTRAQHRDTYWKVTMP